MELIVNCQFAITATQVAERIIKVIPGGVALITVRILHKESHFRIRLNAVVIKSKTIAFITCSRLSPSPLIISAERQQNLKIVCKQSTAEVITLLMLQTENTWL